jgi:hypothetical protein
MLQQQRDRTPMTIRQQLRAQQGQPRTAPARARRKLSAHPAFAPLLGLWGGALAGLSVMVLPANLIAQVAQGSGAIVLGGLAQPILAGLSAVMLGGTMYLVAGGWKRESGRNADASSLVATASRHVRAIDPQRELGSASFDEPVVAMPFGAHPAQPAEEPAVAEPQMPAPRALDLAEFATLPGRNAVWVEAAPADAPMAETVVEDSVPETLAETPAEPLVMAQRPARIGVVPPPRVHPNAAALARLRATPTQELSLAEMVERFAGALQEHRDTAPAKGLDGRDVAAREAALAEALKALASLSGTPAPAPQDNALHDALSQLQAMRGAA